MNLEQEHRDVITEFINDNKFMISGPTIWQNVFLGQTTWWRVCWIYNEMKEGELHFKGVNYRFLIRRFPKEYSTEWIVVDIINNRLRASLSLRIIKFHLEDKIKTGLVNYELLKTTSQIYGTDECKSFISSILMRNDNIQNEHDLSQCFENISTMESDNYKIVLLGDSKLGKSCFVARLMSGLFKEEHTPTLGVEVHPLTVNSNKRKITLNIWDTAGMEEYGGLKDGYYLSSHAAILFADENNKSSAIKWYNGFRKICPTAPVILCYNKFDLMNLKIDEYSSSMKELTEELKVTDCVVISVKDNMDIMSPIYCCIDQIVK